MRETAPEAWEPEQWVDEGSVRRTAESAVAKGGRGVSPAPKDKVAKRPSSRQLALVDELERSIGSRQAGRFKERLLTASASFERERYSEVRSLLGPIVTEVPDLAMARELLGLSLYRLGRWKPALVELEAHRTLTDSAEYLPVIADCYRALCKFARVEEVLADLKAASPSAAAVAEGRIVMAGALADQGKLRDAIKELAAGEVVPRRIRDHHIRVWYVLADLYDRSGDTTRARMFFHRVRDVAPGYADIDDRIAGLGR